MIDLTQVTRSQYENWKNSRRTQITYPETQPVEKHDRRPLPKHKTGQYLRTCWEQTRRALTHLPSDLDGVDLLRRPLPSVIDLLYRGVTPMWVSLKWRLKSDRSWKHTSQISHFNSSVSRSSPTAGAKESSLDLYHRRSVLSSSSCVASDLH